MAPSSAAVAALLRQAVYYHLDNTLHENALFFAERLQAHDPKSHEPTFLLALCHFRLGDYRSACEVSRPIGHRGIHLGCAYVFAQSCLALERFREGITALEKSKGLWFHKSNLGKHTASTRTLYPDAAAVCCLLGKLYRAMDDKKKSVAYFEEALKMNPLMWDAFTSLCDMGISMRVPNIFKVNEALVRNFDQEQVEPLPEQKEGSLFSPLEPLSKKLGGRTGVLDVGDPFEQQQQQQQQQRSAAFQDVSSLGNLVAVDPEPNYFMSKIEASRSRLAASNGHSQASDGMETPLGPAAASSDVVVQRGGGGGGGGGEPPHAPSRKRAAVQSSESSFTDAPSKLSYQLGPKRRGRLLDGEPPAPDQATSMLRSSTVSLSAADRKRTASGHPVTSRQAQADDGGAAPRRSTRLNMFKPSAAKINSGAATYGAAATREKKSRPPISRIMRPGSSGSTVGRVVSGNRKPLEENGMDVDQVEAPRAKEPAKLPEPDPLRVEEGLKWILDLLKKLASGYLALSQFQCHDALQIFNSLPRVHSDTPWVQAQMGRAHYEQASYPEAEKHFRRVRVLARTRLEDMEVYSTILWHLKRETDLSFLAHELVDSAWHSPEAWCALGNAWSLAQDHEQALRCFKRATQLNPKFAYAYTLQGHEHILNEEYDKALTAYRLAISADRRHYNAYYGIGKVYEKLGNYEKAYMHYHAASVIHPTNAVLICCLGTVLEKQKQIVPALQLFKQATDLAPRAAQTRFKKARALLAMGQREAAQQELMILKDLAPEEALVHFLLGRLYKALNNKNLAVRHFTIALSLDPKVAFSPVPCMIRLGGHDANLRCVNPGEPEDQGSHRKPRGRRCIRGLYDGMMEREKHGLVEQTGSISYRWHRDTPRPE